jgi:hypothetical protein
VGHIRGYPSDYNLKLLIEKNHQLTKLGRRQLKVKLSTKTTSSSGHLPWWNLLLAW